MRSLRSGVGQGRQGQTTGTGGRRGGWGRGAGWWWSMRWADIDQRRLRRIRGAAGAEFERHVRTKCAGALQSKQRH